MKWQIMACFLLGSSSLFVGCATSGKNTKAEFCNDLTKDFYKCQVITKITNKVDCYNHRENKNFCKKFQEIGGDLFQANEVTHCESGYVGCCKIGEKEDLMVKFVYKNAEEGKKECSKDKGTWLEP